VKAIKQKILPTADDEFAKDLGDWDTLAALRASLQERLLAHAEHEIDIEVKNALLDVLVQKATFEVPESLVEQRMNARTENAIRGLAAQGMDPPSWGPRGGRSIARLSARHRSRRPRPTSSWTRSPGERASRSSRPRSTRDQTPCEADESARPALRHKLEEEGDLSAIAARIRESKTLDLLRASATMENQ